MDDAARTNDASALPFQLGVTLHSFSDAYCSGRWSLEDLMELTARLGGGIEIVGPSHQRGFPHLTPEFSRRFRSNLQRFGLTPTAYGSYADPFMLPDRALSADEACEYLLPQLHSAAELGFPVVRLQHFSDAAAERLLPVAERLGLRMGYELHVPLMIDAPRTRELIAQIRRLDSPHLGLVPDAGIFARRISQRILEQGRRDGIPEHVITLALQLWSEQTPIEEALAKLTGASPHPAILPWAGLVWDHFGWSAPEELERIARHVIHVHGKFYEMVDGDEPCVLYERLTHALIRIGYRGWLSSEYEGSIDAVGGRDSFALVRAQQDMIRRYMRTYVR